LAGGNIVQRLLIQFLAIILIAVAGAAAYVHINASETFVVSSSEAAVTATPGVSSALPNATATPTPRPIAISKPGSGWGQTTIYLGRYRLTTSSNPKLASTSRLTIALRGSAELSGILSLPPASEASGSYLADFYLTGFTHSGMVRSAMINLGSDTGPAVGAFVVQSFHNNILVATVTFQGEPALTLRFDRYSATS
jgi:hypothetical protein